MSMDKHDQAFRNARTIWRMQGIVVSKFVTQDGRRKWIGGLVAGTDSRDIALDAARKDIWSDT